MTRCVPKCTLLFLVLSSFSICANQLDAANWPCFRGTDGSGISTETGLPTRWSAGEGLAWKTPLPGPGSSSPIVFGDKVFVTCYSGYATSRNEPGDIQKLRRHVLCVDAKSGKVLWDRDVESKQPEEPFRGIGVPNHGYASSTPATDGERVYAFFGKTGVFAFDGEGKEVWRADVAPDARTHNFGTASSPIICNDVLVVPASVECEAVVGFDKRTGKELWRAPASGYGVWWGTPIVIGSGDDAEVVISVPSELWGLNPQNGKLRWYAESFPERMVTPSPVAMGGVIYAIGGRQGGSAAVKTGGRGDVTKSHAVWKQSNGSYITSPVVYNGNLYWVNERGLGICVKAENGEEVAKKRVEGVNAVYSSLVLADGRMYLVSRRDGTFVLEPSPEFKVIARNSIEGDDSDFNASPAISNGRIFLRSDRALYCIGKPAG
jgi:outer membrane protein assembly factor BamB